MTIGVTVPANQLTFKEVIIQVLLINLQFILAEP
jgi:hypothetical protein